MNDISEYIGKKDLKQARKILKATGGFWVGKFDGYLMNADLPNEERTRLCNLKNAAGQFVKLGKAKRLSGSAVKDAVDKFESLFLTTLKSQGYNEPMAVITLIKEGAPYIPPPGNFNKFTAATFEAFGVSSEDEPLGDEPVELN